MSITANVLLKNTASIEGWLAQTTFVFHETKKHSTQKKIVSFD